MRGGNQGGDTSGRSQYWEVDQIRYEYQYVLPKAFFGIEEIWLGEFFKVPITHKERTLLLEGFINPSYFGGFSFIMSTLDQNLRELDLQKIIAHAVHYQTASVAKRLGWAPTLHHFDVHGLSIEAAVLPVGWQQRTIEVRNENTSNATGCCVEAHDLAISKLVAFRDKDRNFVRTLIVEKFIDPIELSRLLNQLPKNPRVTPELIAKIEEWIRGVLRDIRSRT
jgi:hypothetical protein